MTLQMLSSLVVLSLRDPAQAARMLLVNRPTRQVLWMALALVIVLNTILFELANLLQPAPMPVFLSDPFRFLMLVAAAILALCFALHRLGRAFGGQGSLDDILVIVIWLQVLRILVQALMLLLMISVPILTILVAFAAMILGIWISVHFVNEAHGFASPLRAAVVLFASFLAMAFALSIILPLTGALDLESLRYV